MATITVGSSTTSARGDPAYFDVALRDFGLLLAALALARLATAFQPTHDASKV